MPPDLKVRIKHAAKNEAVQHVEATLRGRANLVNVMADI
jgi:hypothetical protein